MKLVTPRKTVLEVIVSDSMDFVSEGDGLHRVVLENLWGLLPGLIQESGGAPAWDTPPERNPFRCGDSSWEQGLVISGQMNHLLVLESFLRNTLLVDLREGWDDELYPGYLACLWDLCPAGGWKRLALLVRYWVELCPGTHGVRMAFRGGELVIIPLREKDHGG